MAFVTDTRTGSIEVRAWFARKFAEWKEARRRAALYRQTVRELGSLTARELTDLGIDRSNIGSIAFEAAYGK